MASFKLSLCILFSIWAISLNAAPATHRHSHGARHGHAHIMHRHHSKSPAPAGKPHVLFESDEKTQKTSPSPSVDASSEHTWSTASRVHNRGAIDETVILW
ncbi:hypothetical protein B0T10DRAFT_473978 [Thelonectria olida]|uniref:Uncharacterized protein n=1 Tax=Thelonectria olida TaxID=1576542 RepID=A0A9P8WGC7_9HYPO|nr:hypothetical protein B0T10DRAFT_473978 [Thelonectria olida]